MQGKKKNYKFISEFIVERSKQGNTSPEKILNDAQQRINEIDDILKQLPGLKKERANLIDVLDVLKND